MGQKDSRIVEVRFGSEKKIKGIGIVNQAVLELRVGVLISWERSLRMENSSAS